jgi:hypothetical protein
MICDGDGKVGDKGVMCREAMVMKICDVVQGFSIWLIIDYTQISRVSCNVKFEC